MPMTNNVVDFESRLRRIDPPSGGGDNGDMEKRVEKLEQTTQETRDRLVRIESRIDNIDRNLSGHYATKADMTESKNSIIMWVVSAILLAQLLPPILKKFGL